ncbi:MAG: hypothetical protein CL811_05855 [Colwelliaceae bacterium]|nr:hypothetical protein [Colwelliaceae bacterium]
MVKYKRFFGLLALFASFVSRSYAGEITELTPKSSPFETLCAVEQPPYSASEYENTGPLNQLVIESFRIAGIKIDVIFSSWARALQDAEAGRCIIAGMWPTKERRQIFYFSERPIIKQRLGIYTLKSELYQQMDGGIIAVERSSYIPNALNKPGWFTYEVTSPAAGANMLASKRVNALYAETGYLNYLINKDKYLADRIWLSLANLQTVNGYLIVSKRKPNAEALISAFNQHFPKVLIANNIPRFKQLNIN